MKFRRLTLVAVSVSFATGLMAQPYITDYAWNPEDETYSESCTSIMVGKNASTDGSVMTAHSCDSNYRTWLRMEKRRYFKKGEMESIYKGLLHNEEPGDMRNVTEKGKIPAPDSTFRFLNVAYPCLNEKQLAIGETTTVGKRSLRNEEGMFYIEELERIALERCTNARDAIKLMGELAEKYGYADSGECLTVADKNEVWHFEIYGTGKPVVDSVALKKGKKTKPSPYDKPGALWVAQRIPDDHVGVSANIPRIGIVDFNDPDNFMYGSDLKARVQHMGLWDGKSEFKFYKMVSEGKPFSYREFFVLNTLAPSLKLSFDAEEIPFSVKPEVKVSPEMMFKFYRETYEGTDWDQVKNLGISVNRSKKDANGKVINYKDTVRPISTFMSSDIRTLLNTLKPGATKRVRTIAVIQCSYSHIIQLRNWLPDEIGGVAYFSFDNPAQSPRIPIYAGATELPNGFEVCGQHRYRDDAAIWAYRQTNRIATIYWDKTRKLLEDEIAYYEEYMRTVQPLIEAKAAELLKAGKQAEAEEFINKTTETIANATSKSWSDLREKILMIFARSM